MTLSKSIIVRVMRRCNFDSPSPEFRIHVFVGDDGQLPTSDEWMDSILSYKVFVTCISRMNSNPAISKHGLRSSSCHLDLLARALDLVIEMNNHTEFNL